MIIIILQMGHTIMGENPNIRLITLIIIPMEILSRKEQYFSAIPLIQKVMNMAFGNIMTRKAI